MERPLASGTREAPLEQPQGSCGPCIVRWQEIISPSYYPLLERAKRYWNGLRPFGTREAQLEQPQASGTREALLEPYGTAFGLLERALAHLERPQGKPLGYCPGGGFSLYL